MPSKIEPKRLLKLSFVVVADVGEDDGDEDGNHAVVSTKIAVASTSFKRKDNALTNCNTSSSLKMANKCVKESTTRHTLFSETEVDNEDEDEEEGWPVNVF